MASDDLSLLLKIKGDSTGGTKAVADARAAIASLRTSATTNFASIQSATRGPLTGMQNLTNITQSLGAATSALHGPLGGIASRISAMGTLAKESAEGMSTAAGSAATMGGSVAALAGPIGIAIVAIAGLTAGAGFLVRGLFNLAVAAADWRGKLFDMSQQTGVAVETLSALEIVAKTTGGSIEGIAASLGIFQKNLEESQDATSKAAKVFNELGVSNQDTEVALRQTLKALAAMPEGFHQTATALELFGRGGKSMLAILKEMDGDLDKATAKFRELGLIVSEEDAKAADEFNDQLALLNFQFRSLMGQEVIPAALGALQTLSKLLSENRAAIDLMGEALGFVANVSLGLFVDKVNKAAQDLAMLNAIAAGLFGYEFLPGKVVAPPPEGEYVSPGSTVPQGSSVTPYTPKAKKGGAGKSKRDTFLQDAKTEAALAEREALKATEFDIMENKRSLDTQVRDIKEFTARAIELADQVHDAAIVRINAEQEALDSALAKKLIKQKEYDIQNRELSLRNDKAERENNEEKDRLEQERDRKIAEAEQAARERALRIAEEADERIIARIRNRIDRGVLLESEGQAQIARIIDEGYARRREALEKEEISFATSLERREAINDELIRLDGERAGAAEDAAERIIKARFDEQNESAAGKTRKRRTTDPDVTDGPKGAVDQLFKAINDNLTGDTQTAALAGLTAMTEAFAGLGQAVGQVVQSFVLYGTAGASVRQVTAQILAGVAQQAAVKAVFELAEGFAALAMSFFGIPNAGPSAAAHFTAAAIYGSIAAVAAVAGRVVAGDSFSKQAAGGSSGGTSGGGGSQGSSSGDRKPSVKDFNRRNLNTPPLRVEFSFKDNFDDVVEARILKRVRQPGDLRNEIGNR